MHNAHFILMDGNEEEVRTSIENELDNWGNENNWYSIRKIIKLSDETQKDYIKECLEALNQMFTKDRVDELIKTVN